MTFEKKLSAPLALAALVVPFFGFQFASAGSPDSVLHPSQVKRNSFQASALPEQGVVFGNQNGCERNLDSENVENGCPVALAIGGYLATKAADYAWEKAATNDHLDDAIREVRNAFDGGPSDLAESGRSGGAVAKPIETGAVPEAQFDNF